MSIALGIGIGVSFAGAAPSSAPATIAAPFSRVNGPTDGPTSGPYESWSAYSASAIANDYEFTVSRQGYNASASTTTYLDTFYVTRQLRQVYPNQASLQADYYALSDNIYSTDTPSGSVTNNSTFTSPKPVANWAMLARGVVANSIDVEVVAFHRNARLGRQVAAVKFIAHDGTDTITSTVSSTTISGNATDLHDVIVYAASLDITSLDDNALITVNAEVYPWIGDSTSVLKSVDSAVGREFSPRYYYKNTTLAAAPYYAVLAAAADAGDGVGTPTTSGVVSTTLATAKATPFSTWVSMIDAIQTARGSAGVDGTIIYVDDGTFAIGSSTNNMTQLVGKLRVRRLPTSTDRASVILTCGTAVISPKLGIGGTFLGAVNTGCIAFEDITLQRSGAQAFLSGNATYNLEIQYNDVTFDRNTQTNTILSTTSHAYINGMTFSSAGNNGIAASTGEVRLARGVSVDLNSSSIEGWLVLGSTITRPSTIACGTTRAHSGMYVGFNRINNPQASNCILIGSQFGAPVGAAVMQNLFEFTSATAAHVIAVSNDSAAYGNTNIGIHHNTMVGYYDRGRVNLFYDEGATPRSSKMMSCIGNIHVQVNTKSDVFATDGTRIGNFAYEYGVGCKYEWSQYIDANGGGIGGSFAQEYPGIGSSLGTSQTTPQMGNNRFTSYAATTWAGASTNATAGAGGGTYTLTSSAECKGTVAEAVLSHTLDGVARNLTGDNPGAYSAT